MGNFLRFDFIALLFQIPKQFVNGTVNHVGLSADFRKDVFGSVVTG